ncbi:hypothetical protein CsatB_008550 [Cannabis sativa]|uniref:FRIGIDA-like protein n=1 Tax=Cannabis sativa TaxID=3483 RepID=A0A7J6DS87_CANSA|nr:uncharacterized protein LOC133032391 [Cannabis sativa]KAF4348955.1 hypothetical protein F8388_019130 [Cannabis sativa]
MEKLAQYLRSFELQRGIIGNTVDELQYQLISALNKLRNDFDTNQSLLHSIFNEIVQREKELVIKEKHMKDGVLHFNTEYARITELKESQLDKVQRCYENCLKELNLKKEEFEVVASKTKQEEERLEAIRKSVKECSCQLELEKKEVEYVKVCKESNIASIKKSKVDMESFVKLKEEEMWSKLEELELLEIHVKDIFKEAELKVKSVSSAQKYLQEQMSKHQQKELEFDKKVDEFKQNLQQLELEKSAWLAEKDKHKNNMFVRIEEQDVEVTIQNLIEIEEVIHAVTLICELKLTHKFSPMPLLLDYINHAENQTSIVCGGERSNKDKIKATKKEIALLKVVKKCVQNCNLQSVFPRLEFYQLGERLIRLEGKLKLYNHDEPSRKRKGHHSNVSQRIKIKYPQKY